MALELFTAEKLLEMALSAIVGDAASGGVNLLWQQIKNRLLKSQPVIEAEIIELEQNPSQENLKLLEPCLQDEMDKDKLFAAELNKLAQEIAQASKGDNISVKEIKAEGNAVAAAKIVAPNSRIGGVDINLGKD
jgi:hypothetical protein